MIVKTIGKTHEGRDIKLVEINFENSSLPIIFIECGIHAREWISPASALFIIDKLNQCTEKGKKCSHSDVQNFQWHIVPLLNPDGYEYSHGDLDPERYEDHQRMWRKNRRPRLPSDPICDLKFWVGNGPGVDLNRNFPYRWDNYVPYYPDVSPKCLETWHGDSSFSEPETQAIRDYIRNHTNIIAAIQVHSYKQSIMYNYMNETSAIKKHRIEDVAEAMSDAIFEELSVRYSHGSRSCLLPYKADGTSMDWYFTEGIDYSYMIELSPRTDPPGFREKEENILRISKHLEIAMKALASKLMSFSDPHSHDNHNQYKTLESKCSTPTPTSSSSSNISYFFTNLLLLCFCVNI